jgi:hypothetical protein
MHSLAAYFVILYNRETLTDVGYVFSGNKFIVLN